MIRSFADRHTEAVFARNATKRFGPDVQRIAQRKLVQLHAATQLGSLAVPPGNGLEALKRDRAGQHAIRVNDPWRICFRWADGNAYDVEITDYH